MYTRYIIDSIMEKADGTYERVETTRHTAAGVEEYLDRLRDDPNCVTVGVSEETYDAEDILSGKFKDIPLGKF